MPLDLVKVERVDPCRTSNPRVTSYLVTGDTIEDQPRRLQVQTINDLRASLCARAKQTERLIWIGWKDSKYGRDIVTVRLDDSKFSYDEQPAERTV
jgi:hypothetical protein